MTRHRLVVVPALRRFGGRFLLADWLAITVGRHILAWRGLSPAELAHELEHVRQWRRHGALFAVRYGLAALWAVRAGGHWYRDNRFERDARAAAEQAEASGNGSRSPA